RRGLGDKGGCSQLKSLGQARLNGVQTRTLKSWSRSLLSRRPMNGGFRTLGIALRIRSLQVSVSVVLVRRLRNGSRSGAPSKTLLTWAAVASLRTVGGSQDPCIASAKLAGWKVACQRTFQKKCFRRWNRPPGSRSARAVQKSNSTCPSRKKFGWFVREFNNTAGNVVPGWSLKVAVSVWGNAPALPLAFNGTAYQIWVAGPRSPMSRQLCLGMAGGFPACSSIEPLLIAPASVQFAL